MKVTLGRQSLAYAFIFVVLVGGVSSSLGHSQEIYDDVEEEGGDEESDPNDEFKNSPMTSSTSVAGETSVLPCNISSDIRGDSVQLVLWYRDNVPTPIYSYDVRSGDYSPPTKWSDPVLLGDRAYFSMTSKPAALVLNQTTRDDQAVYRCRVDYKQFTTTHARVNLTVIEPIRNVKIVDQSGLELVGAAGPYTLGERPTLTCRVQGGDPPPTVTWWRDGLLLDSTYHHQTPPSVRTSTSAPGGTVVNTIHLRALKKEDLRSLYTCKAANHEKAPSKEVAVEIDMNFGPDTVEVHGLEGPLSSGRVQTLVCEAKGSRPPAIITWWLDGHMKKSVSHMTSLDGVVSSSTLELTVAPSDEGKELTCRAENPELPAATIEDSHKLEVLYPPEVAVAAGSSLDLNKIKEGDDVYFDCHVKARPDAHTITWSFNGNALEQSMASGVMTVGRSLVLQKVSRKQAGSYTCSATNTQGSNSSAPIELSVKYSPVCRVEQTDVYGVGRHEKTTVTCRVESDPPVTSYRWAFNNTGEFVDIPSSHFDVKGEGIKSQRSDLRYSPVSDLDYGTLLCWATNDVGTQRIPCTFTVFPAGKPDSVTSCSVFNETEKSVSVSCEPGYSGGVDQSFLVEAWDDGVIKATDTSDTPVMEVTGLRAGTRYTLKVYAVNSMGRSLPYIFKTFTLTDVAERRTALGDVQPGEPLSPILGSIIGGVIALVLLMSIALIIARCKKTNREGHSLREASGTGEVGYKSCGKVDDRTDPSITASTEGQQSPAQQTQQTPGQQTQQKTQQQQQQQQCGPDLLTASQESTLVMHAHDSTTPLMGNGRVGQGQGKLESSPFQQQQTPQQAQFMHQQFLHQYKPQQQQQPSPQQYGESRVNQGPLEVAGGPRYQEQVVMEGVGTPYQRHKVAYVPVYDYQHHPQQSDCEWPAGDDIWGGLSSASPAGMATSPPGGSLGPPPTGMVGGGGGGGTLPRGGSQSLVASPSGTSPVSSYGTVDPRRHSAYLRPLDQLPSQVGPQMTSGHVPDYKHKVQFASPPTAHHPPPTTPAAFQRSSEHESAV